ncbi:hypothetical protein KKI43_23965 [Arthrobacter sp. GN70]|uniref:Uncharacterized protein n=1 Tax=Arthrobacter terricola TaxID=2547396 RepID=A0A4R5K814_9MICC|nr:hypothetical protein [Arthrobacter sp. GN70]TDF89465.1 hypothetical protein E1809_22930 [Arthrobacter terricola]
MSLKDEWEWLDSDTRTWRMENPACLVLPAAMSTKLDARGDVEYDPNGQVVLSGDDHDFIREKAAEAAGKPIHLPTREYRFFDTAPLPVISEEPPET